MTDGSSPVVLMGKAEGEDCGPEIAMTGESLFPIDALPEPIAQFATACAASLSAPAELVAIPALVVAAAAIGNSRVIRLKSDWTEPASVFAAVVSPSGAMKSPALNMAAKPLQDLDSPTGRTWTADVTVEQLARLLAANPRGLLLARDELSAWVKSMNQYRQGKGADRQFYLSVWGGAPVKVDRVGTGAPTCITVPHPCLSVVGCIPPDVMPHLEDQSGQEDGFLPRLLFAWPQLVPVRWTEVGVPQEIRDNYASLIKTLFAQRLNQFITHLSTHFKQLRASAITTDRIKEYVATRREEGAANGTINRELACLKRMFKLAVQSTPAKVARIPHIPMLEEHNVRSGFFSHEEYLAVRAGLPDYAQVAVSIAYYTGLRIGEVLGLKWSQVDLGEGKLSLTPLQTKTETSRVVYLPPDLHRVLLEAKRRHEASYPASPWVCQRHGERLLEIKRCWKRACRRMGLEGRLVHDFRRTAVRNMTRAGIPEKVAMAISGHKTRSVFDRYNIVNETDLKGAAKALATYYEQEKVTLSVTVAELGRQRSGFVNHEPVETSARFVEPAIRIERTTCGLRNRYRGVAQVVDDMGNPLVITGDPQFFQSFGFSSLDRVSA